MCITIACVTTRCSLSLASTKVPGKSDFAAVGGALAELHIADDAIPDPTIRPTKADPVRSTLAAFRRIEVFPGTPTYLPLVAPDGKTVHHRRWRYAGSAKLSAYRQLNLDRRADKQRRSMMASRYETILVEKNAGI